MTTRLSPLAKRPNDSLRDRLRNEPRIRAATSFTDIDTANRAFREALARNSDEITEWLAKGSKQGLKINTRHSEVLGYGFSKSGRYYDDLRESAFVLKPDPLRGFRVHSGWPEVPR